MKNGSRLQPVKDQAILALRVLISVVVITGVVLIFKGALLRVIGEALVCDETPHHSDAIVVLDGGWDGERERWGAHLFHQGYADKIFVTGGDAGWGTSTASLMRNYLVELGIPRTKIFLEERASSTHENAKFLEPLLKVHDVRSILLVTSAYHSRRARMSFARVLGDDGMVITSSPTRETTFQPGTWWYNERLRKAVVLEYLKYIWNALHGYLKLI